MRMRRFLKPLFSKIVLGAIFLILQLALLLFPIMGVYERQVYIDFVAGIIAAAVIIFEINRATDSGFKLIWIAIIALFPVFGVFLYIYVHSDVIMFNIRRKSGFLTNRISEVTEKLGVDADDIKKNAKDEFGIFNYLATKAQAPCFNCSDIEYFPLGEDMFERLMEDIKSAKKYIYLEFFIINEADHMWKRMLSLLCAKAKNGVDVRLVYDAMGCLTTVRRNFSERMREKGIKCHPFSPVKPFVSTYHNNRDHRKMAIIDGKCAYTGGVNIADEYINRKVRFGHWKDTAIRVEGSAVMGFLVMYFKIWRFVCNDGAPREKSMDFCASDKYNGYIVPFDDTPLDEHYVTRDVYLYIINSARNYVYINTPYLILDDALTHALKFAVQRGVDVKICMPHIPDKRYAFALGRSYYPELLKSGVKIYEYKRGFLHAKSTVSDDMRAYVGSANYDYRSLYLHYECGVYLYENPVIHVLKNDYEKTLLDCMAFTMEEYKKLNVFYRCLGKLLRIFAALM